ncbi:uncharacterized protein F54H12.2 [Trichonephila clavipes]|nr:uncharacterized protein F54H12.2 [Trichonephila clavipes]
MSHIMKVPYVCCTKKFEDHYTNHIGSGVPYYEGVSFQKGYGLGGIFRRLFRAALPFLVKGGKAVGKEALRTGTRVVSDVLSGENFKIAARKRSEEAGRGMARKAVEHVQSMIGRGKYKRKRKKQKKVISKKAIKLELFHLPATQTAIERGQWVEFHPLSNVFDGGPVEFHISGSGEEYLDLSQTQLFLKAKIVKSDGSPIEKGAEIGPVNLFPHSLFSQVDITLNERLVSNSSNTYPYRSYIETLLNYGIDSKTSQLTCEMFYKDNEEGLQKRSAFFESSASVDMIGPLHCDLFHQERLLLNLVDLKIKLIRIRKVHVSPGVVLGHMKALEKETAKYPINRVLCKVYSIPQGSMSFVQDNIFIGQMPKRIVVGCVDNDSFHGTFEKSPFDFKHYDINFIGVYVDGQPTPHNPLDLNFAQNNYIKGYHSLFSGTEKLGQDQGLFISREEYISGNTLFAFNLSPDLCTGDHLNLIKHGVYASDTIPILKKKSTIVVNLDASSQPGSHWLAFYHENNCIEFFDSYGYPPEYYGEGFRDFVSKFSTVSWNCIPFQSPTSNRSIREDATSKPFSYLLIDLKPDTSDSMRLRSGLFPGDTFFVYQPR